MKRGSRTSSTQPPASGDHLDAAAVRSWIGRQPILAAALAIGGAHVAIVVAIAAARLAYPFQLDWLEGALLEQVARVRAGMPLYVEPSVSFVPLVYTPLYTYAGAAMSWIVGPGFLSLRAVSAIAAALTLIMIGVYVSRETGRRSAGLMAIALYAAGQHLAESWLDVGRSDSLYLSLIVGGAFCYRSRAGGIAGSIATGALWALAFLTKQSAPIVLAPLLLWLVVREGRRGRVVAASFALLSGLAVLALDLASAGWFHYYTLILPAKFALDPRLAGRFFVDMIPLLPAIAVAAGGIWARARSGTSGIGFHLALGAGLALGSWYLRLYPVAGENDLLPGVLAVALLAGLGLGWLMALEPASRAVTWVPSLLLCVQLVMLFRDPFLDIPHAEDRAAGEDLVRRLAAAPGPVYVSYAPYLLRLAGRATHAHVAPLMDMIRAPRDSVQERLYGALQDSLRSHQWSLLVLDRRDWLREEAEAAGYREIARVFREPQVFLPVTGYATRPEWVMAPAEQPRARGGARDSSAIGAVR